MDQATKEMQRIRAHRVKKRRIEIEKLPLGMLIEKYLELYNLTLQKSDLFMMMAGNAAKDCHLKCNHMKAVKEKING